MSSLMSTMDQERRKEGNQLCTDCSTPDPSFVSLDLGAFICAACAKIHRQMKPGLNRVAAHLTYTFTDDEINFISTKGNKVVNEVFEKHLPKYYHRPSEEDDHALIREQFIKAKYERKEFQDLNNQQAYGSGSKEGVLFKRGKGNDKFLQRRFVLKEPEGTLKYYVKPTDKTPKDTIVIRNLVNVYVVPDKIKNNNGMQITHEKEGTRRNLFVFGIDGKTTSDWYHALRASMMKHKYQNFPDDQMKKYLNTRIIQEGWMSKTGPKRMEKFRRRWFTLVGNMIWYYTQPLDAHPLGYIPLGSRTFGYGVMKGLPQGIKSEGFSLTVHTPDRIYALVCFTLESRDKWVECIEEALNGCTTVWSQATMEKIKVDTSKNRAKYSSDSDAISSQGSSSNNTTPKLSKKTSKTLTPRHVRKKLSDRDTRKVHSLIYKDSDKNDSSKKLNGILKKTAPKKSHLYSSDDSDGIIEDFDSDTENVIHRVSDTHKSTDSLAINEREITSSSTTKQKEKLPPDLSQNELIMNRSASPSSDRSGKSLDSASKRPKKPPRKRLMKQGTASSIELSDQDSVRSSCEIPSTVKISPDSLSNEDNEDKVIPQDNQTAPPSDHPDKDRSTNEDNSDFEYLRPSSVYDKMDDESCEWRKKTFSSSVRRITGNERMMSKKTPQKRVSSISSVASSALLSETKDVKARSIDVTLCNQIKDGFWFMIFQSEVKIDDLESYVTPWIGAQIAESPASVGPIKVPGEFQIAVIDTAPGGFGIQRTTGPFPAEPGDVWEVEAPNEDAATPEMFYHEGMVTDDGSVTVYSNISNMKKFEIAVFKSGRKLFSRKNVKAGDVVVINIKPTLYFLAVDQDTYFDMEEQDIRASEFLHRTHCIELNYRQSRVKVHSKKRGSTVYFTKT